MEKFKLNAKVRELTGKAAKRLRVIGEIPAVLYGKKKENQNLSIALHDFRKLYTEAGTSSIVLLDIKDSGTKNVLVQDIDFDPLTNVPRHIDFYEVSMTEKITTNIPLHFVGDSVAVIEQSGTLVTNKDEVEVECLPADLPHEIEVDISVLADFETAIHVRDLKVASGVEIKDDPEEMVATVEPPRSEEEMAELEEPVETPELPAEEGAETEEAPAEESENTEKTE